MIKKKTNKVGFPSAIRHRADLWKLLPGVSEIAEIGVAEGNFSRDMLEWKFPDGRWVASTVYMVDRWKETPEQFGDASMPQSWHDENLRQVRQKIKAYGQRAIILRGDSEEMASEIPESQLALVYIDADHSYEGVLRDLRVWVPKVRPGGIVALHDYLNENYGVKKAVEKFCSGKYEVNVIEENKPEDAGAWFVC